MNSVWKYLLAPTIAGFLGGYILLYVQQIPSAAIVAELSSLEMINPLAGIDYKKVFEARAPSKNREKVATELSRVSGNYLRIRMLSLIVKNESNYSSKSMEVSLPDGGILVYYDSDNTLYFDTRLDIGLLPPGASRTVTALLRPDYGVLDSGILITHDGKKVEPTVLTMDKQSAWLGAMINSYPTATRVFVFVGAFSSMLFLVIALSSPFLNSNLPLRAKLTPNSEAKIIVTFAEYLKVNHRDKLT